ncbi:hypothetical protein FGO68_gene5934 [Halteria grandinella]|uniref:Thioredoxin domain-containing protein n=1 Tax=Halteria grandinella TaxID=5974 RepID=A0A8J8P3T8_HALGN|nr:hypothetical protein FGO68_gene5934 [Halteria grandinella]
MKSLLLFTWVLILQLASGQGLPDGWHLNIKAPSITSYDSMISHCQSESKNKHIFLDFFTPGCPYCYQFMDDFNRLHDQMLQTYGEEQIAIFKVNGWETAILSQAFRVPYYPFFLYIAPNTPSCAPSSYFNNDQRTFETMLQWMIESAGHNLVKKEMPKEGEKYYDFQNGERDKSVQSDGILISKFNKVIRDFNHRQQRLDELIDNFTIALKGQDVNDSKVKIGGEQIIGGYFVAGLVVGALIASILMSALLKKIKQSIAK